jgi:hypothetical protein
MQPPLELVQRGGRQILLEEWPGLVVDSAYLVHFRLAAACMLCGY